MRDIDEVLASLQRSDFRRRQKLTGKDLVYLREKGIDNIREHTRRFVVERLAGTPCTRRQADAVARPSDIYGTACNGHLLSRMSRKVAPGQEGRPADRDRDRTHC